MIRDQRYEPRAAMASVKPHPKNARRGDLEAIESSIAANGFYGAIIVHEASRLIMIGNHRYRAAAARGLTEIPMIFVTCTDVEAERIAVADNRTSDLGTYDSALLVEQLQRIADGNEGSIAGTGYSPEDFAALEDELKRLAKQAARDEKEATGGPDKSAADDLDTLRVPSEPITKRGDLWLLGEHRILCGDSFDIADRRALFRGEAVDVVVTDPPYAIYGSSTGIGADIADDKMVRPFFADLFRTIQSHAREFAHVYVCCDWRSWSAIWEGARAAAISPKNCIVWDKGGGLGSMYSQCYEMVGFFSKLPPPTAMRSTTRRGQRTVMQPNVMRLNRVTQKDREHNAQKPVALFEWLIKNSTEPGELVADFFLGSGTTIVAAEQSKRRAYGMELEPKNVDISVARWERATGARARRVPAEENTPATVDASPPVAHGAEVTDTP